MPRGDSFVLMRRYCPACDLWCYLAVRLMQGGNLHPTSPRITRCYSCQLAEMTPEERVAARVRFAKLWRLTTNKPLPQELSV